MFRNLIIVTITIISMLNCVEVISQEIQNPELAKEIRKMRDEDQKLRGKYVKMFKKGKTESKSFKVLRDKVVSADSSNTERMKEIVAQYGWPTYNMVGKRASVSAWLLVQHADRNPLFQLKCLPLLKEASENGQSDPVNYAFLYDRVQVALGEKQLYATQSSTNNGIQEGEFFPLEDEWDVQNRRSIMGFDLHIETYANQLGFEYKVPSKAEAQSKAEGYEKAYNTSISRAKRALEQQDLAAASDHYIAAHKNNGSIKIEDLVEAARTLSLAKHEDSYLAIGYLLKAAIRGWDGVNSIETDTDFEYIKNKSQRNWNNLMRIVDELKATN